MATVRFGEADEVTGGLRQLPRGIPFAYNVQQSETENGRFSMFAFVCVFFACTFVYPQSDRRMEVAVVIMGTNNHTHPNATVQRGDC